MSPKVLWTDFLWRLPVAAFAESPSVCQMGIKNRENFSLPNVSRSIFPLSRAVCLYVSLSFCLPVCLSSCLSLFLFVCLPICLPVCLSVYLSSSPVTFMPHLNSRHSARSVRLPSLAATLSVCLPVCLPVFQFPKHSSLALILFVLRGPCAWPPVFPRLL